MKGISSTRIYVTFMGILAGFAASIHGLSEVSRGNVPTEGFLLETVGAFTIIPNYLATGTATIIVALAMVLWVIFFIHKKNGPIIFLAISILLFLVGGGVAQVVFLSIVLAVSTKIDKPLPWWEKIIHEDLRKRLAKLWLPIFVLGSLLLSIGIGIWLILIPPGTTGYAPVIYLTCWTFLALGLLSQFFIIVAGFARDLEINGVRKPENK